MTGKLNRSLLGVCAVLLCSWPAPGFAQQGPPKDGNMKVVPNAPFTEFGTVSPRDLKIYEDTRPKVCFWQDKSSGTPFGKSGFCPTSSAAAVGDSCRCSSNTVGRPDGKWVGKVMLAPTGTGAVEAPH